MSTVTLTIDGRTVTAESGATVLEAALANGIYVPSLCYHPDLEPYGGCRMCLVEIEGMRGLPTSCTTTVAEGMKVTTRSDALAEVRINTLNLILSQHPCECLVCHRRHRCGPDDVCLRQVAVTDRCVTCPSNEICELQQVVDYLGVENLDVTGREPQPRDIDTSNPFFDLDRNRCILCARCVRTCWHIEGAGTKNVAGRGARSHIITDMFQPWGEAESCTSCGKCVMACPTGALFERGSTTGEMERDRTKLEFIVTAREKKQWIA
jgi:bidirectional [NiFe] hydrogenase diaphorase subunit